MKKAFLLCVALLTLTATTANAQFIGVDNVSVPLFESVKDSWFRIIVKTKTGQKEGWTKNYCPNIYGSCESGVVY